MADTIEVQPTASLGAALATLQTRLPQIRKGETAKVETAKGSYSYTYAGLAQISAQILPLLGGLGLSFIAKPTFLEGRFVLAYSLLHVSGEREDGQYPLPTSGTPQAIGSAITYGRRYCLCAVTGIAPEDDDDASAAEAEAQASRGTAQRQRRQAAPSAGGDKPSAQRARAAAPPLPGEATGVTDPQLQKIVIGFDDLGVADRAERLQYTSRIVGRELGSAKELTKAEAHQVIEMLEQAKAEDDPFAFLAHAAQGGGDQ